MSTKIEPPSPRREPQPPVTIRELLERGPKFEPEVDATWLPVVAECITCRDVGHRHIVFGICRACWRAWRWSPRAEFGIAGHP